MKTAAIVFLAALLIRLVALAVILPQLKPGVDHDWYRSLARNLGAGRGFVADEPDGELLPQVDRTPGYPAFLVVLMWAGGDRLGWFLAVQCVVGAATCALTVLLARRWLTEPFAAVAGLLVAVDPNSVMRCLDLRTETLFTMLLVTGACLLAWGSDRRSWWWPAGLVWSTATLCRPIAIGLCLVALGVALAGRNRWQCFAAFLLGFVPLIALWSARNAALTGRWFFSTAATYNLYVVRASGVEAERLGVSHNEMQDRFGQRFRSVQFFKDRTTFESALRGCRRAAREILAGSPWIAAKQFVRGWCQVLLGPGARGLENSLREPSPPPRVWPVVYAAVLAAITLAGIAGALKLGRAAVLLPLLVLYFVVLSGGGGGNSRFRTPITPVLAILAVAGTARKTT